jgi:exopolysaccharide biosynthesis WecB/TagA/CpsF family protein
MSSSIAEAVLEAEEPDEIPLLGLQFANLTLDSAANVILTLPPGQPFGYVVTPNADHLVRMSRDPATILPLYEGAWIRLLDSRVVAGLARGLGRKVPPVVPGSDLTAALVAAAVAAKEAVTVVGLDPDQAAELVARTGLLIKHYCPPFGFEKEAEALGEVARFVETNPSRLVFLAVGSPRQELLAKTLVERGRATGTGLCIGASLHFLAGVEKRAPGWMQKACLEWAWRLGQSPRRLAKRYLWDDPKILWMLMREPRT